MIENISILPLHAQFTFLLFTHSSVFEIHCDDFKIVLRKEKRSDMNNAAQQSIFVDS